MRAPRRALSEPDRAIRSTARTDQSAASWRRLFLALGILVAGIILALLDTGGGFQLPLVRGVRASALHQIAIRTSTGLRPQLYDRRTGRRFWPEGANYVELTPQFDAFGHRILYHGMFNLGWYDPQKVQAALSEMSRAGYNTVRVFLDPRCARGCLGAGGGLSRPYLANVADFLRRAARLRLQVVLTTDFLPAGSVYSDVLDQAAHWPFAGENADFLTSAGVTANAAFWHDLVADLVRLKAPIETILAYELRNEAGFDWNAPPLRGIRGRVHTANGRTYDLSDLRTKRAMLSNGLVYWIGRVRAAIREVDPSALIAIGFPQPGPTDLQSMTLTEAAIENSAADVVDVHLYLGTPLDASSYARELDARRASKPVLVGEYGAFKDAYPSAQLAADALLRWREQSCQLGYNGWLLWSWDTAAQTEIWNARAANGAIEHALAPGSRPCG